MTGPRTRRSSRYAIRSWSSNGPAFALRPTDRAALGDVTSVALFTHVAKYQARIVADTIFGKPRRADYTAIPRVEIRACFLGHGSFSVADLAGYRGPKPQHHGATCEELREAAGWIRRRSTQLHDECRDAGVPYVDVGEVGFQNAMVEARRHLLGPG